MVGRLADAAPDAAEAALSELCTAFELAGAGVLQHSAEPPGIALIAEACVGRPGGLRELVGRCPGPELERLLQLSRRGAPFVLDPAAREPGLERIRAELSQSMGALLGVRLELGGAPGVLLLLASEGKSFTSNLLLRLRLLADILSIAAVLGDRRQLPGELNDQQLREFERRNLLAVIERCGWRLQGADGAAHALGLSPSTLRDRMRSFGIQRPR